MRIIAYYRSLDPNVVRRAAGPLSVLSQRGHQMHFNMTLRAESIATNYDIVLLPNWAVEISLPVSRGTYVYDLSDGALLHDDRVLSTIQQCGAVSVPTDTLATLVRPYCPRVAVIPSYIHAEWLFSSSVKRPTVPLIACIGNFPWEQAQDGLLAALKELPETRVLTDNPEFFRSLPEKRRTFIEHTADMYPYALRGAFIALFPGERREQDPGLINEFNLFGVPAISGPAWAQEVKHGSTGMIARSSEQWKSAILRLSEDDAYRRGLASAAQASARTHTVVRNADSWLASMSKLCPTSGVLSTLK